jgi:LCP family protein required for cell wall assembly
LVWLVFFLVAGLAAIVADLWLRPGSDGSIAEAVGPAQSAIASTPLPPSATVPVLVASEPIRSSAVGVPITPPPCVPPDDWSIYVVEQGNTLPSLARRYNTDIDTLSRVNCLNTHTIFIGQRLYVPVPPITPSIPTPSATQPVPPTTTPRPGASATAVADLAVASNLPPTPTPLPAYPISIPDHYLNIVLLGSDKRPGSGTWRTDSMIIVSVDTQNNLVRLLSIPRDLWVYIPGHGDNRINTADLWGELAKRGTGPDRVKQTIHHNLGIPIHYYVRVDFQGFMNIIDTVGGIDVDVDCPLPDIKLSAGMHHLNGQQALRYARSRKSTNDFDRGRRQRKVLMALWDQALTLDIIPRLPELWWTMATTFQTDLSLEQVINLAYVGAQLEPQRILSRSINASHVRGWMTPQGASVLLPRHPEIRTMLDTFYNATDLSHLDAAGSVRIAVVNSSRIQDADRLAAAALRWNGYTVTAAGLAGRQDYAQTQIIVHTGNVTATEQIARQLRVPVSAIQEPTSTQQQLDPANPVDIQVILGHDYNPCQR